MSHIYRPFNCLFHSLCRLTTKKTSKLCIISPLWGRFPSQRTSNEETVSMSLCHHREVIECLLWAFSRKFTLNYRSVLWIMLPWIPSLINMAFEVCFFQFESSNMCTKFGRLFSYWRVNSNNLRHFSVKKSYKFMDMFIFTANNLGCIGTMPRFDTSTV